MKTVDLNVTCPVCDTDLEIEGEIEGDILDPSWIVFPEECPSCEAAWPEAFKNKIEERIYEAGLETIGEGQYDTLDEYLADKEDRYDHQTREM